MITRSNLGTANTGAESPPTVSLEMKADDVRWNQRVEELQTFNAKHGHFKVPRNTKAYKLLGNWLKNNITEYNNIPKGITSNRLTDERIAQLESIGFQFNQSAQWNQRVQELKDFYEEHGHFSVPRNKEAYKSLSRWLKENQTRYNNIQIGIKSNRLTEERIAQLDSIGFNFTVPARRRRPDISAQKCPIARWNQRVQELKDFYGEHGHFDVPHNTEANRSLKSWMKNNQTEFRNIQRGMKSNRLTNERIAQLESIGFKFMQPARPDSNGNNAPSCLMARWNHRVQELQDFHEEHGHYKVPRNTEPYKPLGNWLKNIVTAYGNIQKGKKSSRLSKEKIAQLESIGFQFKKPDSNVPTCAIALWNQRVLELKDFNEEHGHFNVPNNVEAYKSLSIWLNDIKTEHNKIQKGRKSHLTDEQITQLESIGYEITQPGASRISNASNTRWNERVQELKDFYEEHGHFKVPGNLEGYKPLKGWLNTNQLEYTKRKRGEKSRLTDERITQLESIGFKFNCLSQWNQRVQELEEFQAEHGHFKVPRNIEAYKSLKSWLNANQTEYNRWKKGTKSRLTEERINQLESIGFLFADRGNGGKGALSDTSESKSEEPEDLVEYEASNEEGASLHSSESISNSDEEAEVIGPSKRDDWNTTTSRTPGTSPPPVPQAASATYEEPVPEKASTKDVAASILQKESSLKLAEVAPPPSTRTQDSAPMPSFMLELEDAVNAMTAEMNRIEQEEKTTVRVPRKPNTCWLDIGDRNAL